MLREKSMRPLQPVLAKRSYDSAVGLARTRQVKSSVGVVAHRGEWGFPEFFVLSQTILPTLLYIPGVQFIRVPIRMSAFAVSLFGLAWYGKKIARSGLNAPALKWLAICFVYLGLMIFHPRTNSLLAGIAQVMLYLSVLAPMFLASHLKYTPQRVQRLLFIILVCSGINALVGVLQVYDPGTR